MEKYNKKLKLNKEKISELNQESMDYIYGGAPLTVTCATKCIDAQHPKSRCVCPISWDTYCMIDPCNFTLITECVCI